jgi:hypothetical protein
MLLLAWEFLHLDAAGVRYYRRSSRTGRRDLSRPGCRREGAASKRGRRPSREGSELRYAASTRGRWPSRRSIGTLNSDGSLAVPSTSPPSKRGTSAGAAPPRARNRPASPGAARGLGQPRPWAPSPCARGCWSAVRHYEKAR